MKIYIMTHKPFKNVTHSSIYVPLLVGAEKNFGKKEYLKDNSIRDNISDKNSNFCELTGAYWIWKASQEDIVGLCHYRRYFCTTKHFFQKYTILSENQIRKYLDKYDIILPSKNHYEYNNKPSKIFFAENHDIEIWENCKRIIKMECPEYFKDFEWFEQETTGYCYNMLITRKALYDTYSKWLFQILFKLEKITDIDKYNGYNARMYGFLSERLLNVWCHHNQLKIKEVPVYNSEFPNLYHRFLRKILDH